jgi:hypothetical protein
MLRAASTPMTRKILVLAVVLTISSLASATAVIGFCAKMPCCFAEGHEGLSVARNDADCCTPVNCYEAPSQDLTVSAKAKSLMATVQAAVAVIVTMPDAPAVASHSFDDSSPPPTTRQRLSSLSILLI